MLARETQTNKEEKITIVNDKGRLSKEEIEEMVKNGEKFKAEDELIKQKVDAKNELEQYIYNVEQQLEEANLKDKFKEEDK